MDLKRTIRRSNLSIEEGKLAELYPHDLQLYDTTPISNVLLHEFEEMAVERLKVLKAIETVSLRGLIKFSPEWRTNLMEELNKQGLKSLARLVRSECTDYTLGLKSLARLYTSSGISGLKSSYAVRRRDHISHFILCLTFCNSDELRHWFLSKEQDLFITRFEYLSPEGLQLFLKINNFEFKPISNEEKRARSEDLRDTFQYLNTVAFESTSFYKVPFRKVVELVKARKVLLVKGQGYIAASDLGTVLAARLRQEIAHSLAVLKQFLPETKADLRLDAVLHCLLEQHQAGTYRVKTENVDVLRMEDLDEMSKRSFPPCMRRLHETLKARHHLRHFGRQQYQLFLKGAGMPLDEALRFWRSEFCRIMASDKFEKEHSYNIRHNYGQEGNRCNYSPYGCNKIIGSQPGPEDYHGCPFRHSQAQPLRKLLLSYGISEQGLAEVMDYTEKHSYTLACQKLFVLTHPDKGVEFGLTHPNEYYRESRQLVTGVRSDRQGTTGSTPLSNYNSSASSTSQSTPQPSGSQSTPLSSNERQTLPSSTRRALPTSKPVSTLTSNVKKEADVKDWLDEPDEDFLSQLDAMDTQKIA